MVESSADAGRADRALPASPRRQAPGRLGLTALVLAGCGGSETKPVSSRDPTPDPKYLVVRESDVPPRFTVLPGETFPTPLESVLADPWSTGYAAVIRRERVAGYQTSFWSPESGRFECAAAVYRSVSGARDVFRYRTAHFAAYVRAGHGRSRRVETIGDETHAFRFVMGRLDGRTVTWRYRNVLASCTTATPGSFDLELLAHIALAQQERIAAAIG